MFERLVSCWEDLFSAASLVSGRVYIYMYGYDRDSLTPSVFSFKSTKMKTYMARFQTSISTFVMYINLVFPRGVKHHQGFATSPPAQDQTPERGNPGGPVAIAFVSGWPRQKPWFAGIHIKGGYWIIQIYVYVCIGTYTYMYIFVHIYTYMHTYRQTCKCIWYTYAQIYTYSHIHDIYIYIHKCELLWSHPRKSGLKKKRNLQNIGDPSMLQLA